MEKLHIFIGRERLGELRIIDAKGSMDLVYDPAWLSAGGFSVSPHLPPSAGRPDSVHNFLANLLPEGEWLEDLSRNATCSKANIFALIAYIGTETTGALSFVPEDGGAPPTTSFREVTREELSPRGKHGQSLCGTRSPVCRSRGSRTSYRFLNTETGL